MIENKIQKVHALTNNNSGLVNSIVTSVEITNVFTDETILTKGIWDTGATDSVVTKSTAISLGLKPIRRTKVRDANGEREVNVYYVKITLNNKNITLKTPVTECNELSGDNSIGMLIGMNIITMGDFAITNYQRKTTMSFRVPSLQIIDFVSGIRTGQPIIKDKVPGKNDPCSCGSNKKYKHCCGKYK